MTRVKIIQADIPTTNGNVYTAEALTEALEKFAQTGKPLMAHLGSARDGRINRDLQSVVGVIKDLKMDDKGVVTGTFDQISTRLSDALFQTLTHDDFAFTPSGVGNIVEREGVKEVTDYTLVSISVIAKHESAVKFSDTDL